MNIIEWLLDGDVSIQYQVHRDLLGTERPDLQRRIEFEGFGKRLLDEQQENGHWGGGYYHYKWINTHYTLLEIRRLNMIPNYNVLRITNTIANDYKTKDGGITPNPDVWEFSDVCINGMSLFFMCNFRIEQEKLISVVDFIISQQLPDGGFNCNFNYKRYGAIHSSLHSTVSLIEGINEYLQNGYTYKAQTLRKIREEAIEFILMHKLYISDKTGKIINRNFLMLSYPPRWKYDILRAMEAFMNAGIEFDERMQDALNVIIRKRRKDRTWPVQHKHAGKVHFDMEKTGGPSRWNTLRVLRVLMHFKPNHPILDEL